MLFPNRNLKRYISKFFKQPGYALKVLFKRLRAYSAYKAPGGISPMPEAVTLFLTHRCNLRCKMCGQWGEGGVTKKMAQDQVKQELDLKSYKALIDDLSAFKPNITLFGGEPLLHPACLDIIRHIKKKKMHCLIITNGSLLKEYAYDLVEAGLDELNVSLDGARGLHDSIRGMVGLFDQITTGLKEVAALKKEKKTKTPLVNLQCTITKYNYLYLDQLLEVASQVKADSLTFHHLIFLDPSLIEKQKKFDQLLNCSSSDWQGFVFSPDIDVEALYFNIEKLKKYTYPFSVDIYPNFSYPAMRQYYQNPAYSPKEYASRCLSPWICAYVFPDGEVKPCLNSSYSFGNISKYKFKDIVNGPGAVKFRTELKKNKIFPVCVRCTELYRY